MLKRINFDNRWIKISLHILVWVVIFSLPYLTSNNASTPRPVLTPGEKSAFFKLNLYGNIFWIGIFYLNSFLLLPKFFNQKKYNLYTLSLILVFALVMAFHALLFKTLITFFPFRIVPSLRFNLPIFVLAIVASFAYRMTSDKIKSDNLQMQKEKENMKSELSFLRSQISPHFILNVLNNIVALNRLKSSDLEPTLMKLSGLMQYILYETDEEKVLIRAEADYLQSYIDLQQQRFGNKVEVHTHIDITDEYAEIEPMLLIPFVENAFRHGVGMIYKPEIDIELTTNKENELFFLLRNRFNESSSEIKDRTSGIGLVNVQRRLDILYSGRHELKITKKDEWFEVLLTLKLH
jgi:two-component system, LytTR family, sensor kinase